jgi:S-adenosylmethionine hydrolase
MAAPICFLSDFGLGDAYVGVVKGVILTIAPEASIVDLSHEVLPQDVRSGAFVLMVSVPYFPKGTVFLTVVDPGVGTGRRAIAIEAAGYLFVAPDNGLVSWAILRLARMGRLVAEPTGASLELSRGVSGVVLDQPRYWRSEISATFHGRDVFGPVAAYLSRGVPPSELGHTVDSIVGLPFPLPRVEGGVARGEVVYVDRYGNLVTNLEPHVVGKDPIIGVGDRTIEGISDHFQQEAELIALIGSSGFLEVAVPNGSAARTLEADIGTPVSAGAASPDHPVSVRPEPVEGPSSGQ